MEICLCRLLWIWNFSGRCTPSPCVHILAGNRLSQSNWGRGQGLRRVNFFYEIFESVYGLKYPQQSVSKTASFFWLWGTTQGNGSLVIFDAVGESIGGGTLVCSEEHGMRAMPFIFPSSVSFFLPEDRERNGNNSYKPEPALRLFGSLWLFTVIQCFTADISVMRRWIWQRVGQRPVRWLSQ